MRGEARESARGRTVIELEAGITVYPPQEAGGRWRAVWTEDGRRRYCEAVTEEKLATKLAKVTERLEADASGMERSGSDLIAWYLSPDRFPGDEQWSRKHVHTQRWLCERFVARGHRRRGLPGHPGCRHAADRQCRFHRPGRRPAPCPGFGAGRSGHPRRVPGQRPLVLLHGVGKSAVGWRPVQEALSRRYDVIVLDFPGFGGSPKLSADTLPGAVALADAVEREMDQLGIGDFHVAGYSLGARISLELATRGRIRSVVAIAPDGLGTPPERVYQAAALMAGRMMATLLAPVATPVTASGPGRSLFFAMERSRAWKLTRQDARQLLLNFASSSAYEETVLASMSDIPAGLDRITCPVLIMQGTADPLISAQSPRFLTFIPHAQFRWLYGLSHVPISDDPELVTGLMLDFLNTTTEGRVLRESLPAPV